MLQAAYGLGDVAAAGLHGGDELADGGVVVGLRGLEPCDVEVGLVARQEVGHGEAAEALGLAAGGEVVGIVAADEVVEVMALHRARGEGVLDAGAVVVVPHGVGRASALEEEHIGLDALGVEDARGEAQDGVQIVVRKQFLANRFARTGFEQHVVGQHHGGTASVVEHHHDVLQEVELVVLGLDEEVLAVDIDAARGARAEGGIGEDDIDELLGHPLERVFAEDGRARGADAVQIEVHRGEGDDEGGVVVAEEGLVAQEVELLATGRLEAHVVVGRQQEAARAAGGVAHCLAYLRARHIDHGLDERAGREVLACARLLVLAILFEDALVDGALDVAVEVEPVLLVDHGDDFAEIDGLVDLVLRLDEDGADQAFGLREVGQRLLVLLDEVHAVERQQVLPSVALGDGGVFAEEADVLVVHLEEEQVGELGDIVGEADALAGEGGGQGPDFLG